MSHSTPDLKSDHPIENEHKPIKLNEYSEEARKRIPELAKCGQGKSETLGLYYLNADSICPGDFIGAIGVGDDVLQVNSKFDKPKMDYIKMFTKCCEHSDIGERMSNCFQFWSEQDLIKLPNADDFSPMIVIAYLRELNQLCVRRLRRHFERQQENFTGKVKGRILVGENIRRNVTRVRPDRIFCEYQSISDNILENRILRAALEKAACYISQNKMAEKHECLNRWIYACRTHLQGVSVTHISRRDFSAARKRGVFAFYRRPLNLAKAVFCRFGFNPHEENNKPMLTPPYAINSAKLFEYYAELYLRNEYKDRNLIVQGWGKGDIRVNPDFYFSRTDGEPWVIDAKYKKVLEEFEDSKKKSNQDFYQVIAYSRHRDLLEKINENIDDKEKMHDIKLSLAYPSIDKLPEERKRAFLSPVTIYRIPYPVKER